MDKRRFEPSLGRVVRENAWVAIGAGITVPLILYFDRGERDPVVLAAFGIMTALACFVFYVGREKWRGLSTLEVSKAEIRVIDKRGDRAMKWSDVVGYEHELKGGVARWKFLSKHDGRSLDFNMEGHSTDAWGDFYEAVLVHLDAQGLVPDDHDPDAVPSAV